MLHCGAGIDTLIGGSGNETYVFNLGDGSDTITDLNPTPGNSDTIRLGAGITAASVQLNGVNNDLVLSVTGTTDSLTVKNWFYGDTSWYRIERLQFADGTVNQIGSRTDLVNTLTGTGLTDYLSGNSEPNVLKGLAGNDFLYSGAGNDVLDGGTGVDSMAGGVGDDTYLVDNASDVVTEVATAGTDTVQSEITSTLGSNVENLTLTGSSTINATGNGLNNVLTGNSAPNILNGAAGNDTYIYNRGGGQDTVVDNDSTVGNSDKLQFGAGITPFDLMLTRSVNDLKLAIYGSPDQVTIQNWYNGASNQTETIQTDNGQRLINTQVDQLIQAMATFSVNSGLNWSQAIDQRPQDVQAIVAANWQ